MSVGGVEFLQMLVEDGIPLKHAMKAAKRYEFTQAAHKEKQRTYERERKRAQRTKSVPNVPGTNEMSRMSRGHTEKPLKINAHVPGTNSVPRARVEDKPLRIVTSGKASSKAKAFSHIPSKGAFEEFWLAYPSKVGKRDAAKKFETALRRIDAPDPLQVMLGALERAKATERWRGGYIPNPATWLNQDRWEDDLANNQITPPPKPAIVDEDWIKRQQARLRKSEYAAQS